jgi:hypothetical protein
MSQVNVENVVTAYLKLREQRGVLKKEYDQKDEVMKDKMERLNTWLLGQMQATGSTQLGCESGTAYQQTVMKGSCGDWPNFWNWIGENGRFDMMEKRVSVKTIQEYYQESGELPPGININPELRVVVRKS